MRVILAFLTVLILLAAFAPFASALERTPPGSYLEYRATTVGELRSQVSNNKIVQARYASHFGIPAAQLDKALLSKLTLIALKQPLRTRSWYISKSGKALVRVKLLPRGTMVFAMRGEPVLAWSCGNPLGASLPTNLVKATAETVSPKSGVETKVLASPVETISTAVIAAPPVPAVAAILPVETPPVLASIAAPAISIPPVISSNIGGGWLAALGGLGGIAASFKKDDHPTVPEPSNLVAIGSLLAMMPVACRFRRQKH